MTAFKFCFLGTGDSAQVPVYNCSCVACARANKDPGFVRRPCSASLQLGSQQWVIDSGRMDLATLFPHASLHGILQTHYHADHAQGLLHLRWGVNASIPVWGPDDPIGFADLYKHPGILDFSNTWQPFETRHIEDVAITAVPLTHSKPTLGYVLQSATHCLAYLTDTVGLPADTYAFLKQLHIDYCVVDCTVPPQPQTPRNHNDVTSALAMCGGLQIDQLWFTHIGHELDVWLIEHLNALPKGVHIARDGLCLDL